MLSGGVALLVLLEEVCHCGAGFGDLIYAQDTISASVHLLFQMDQRCRILKSLYRTMSVCRPPRPTKMIDVGFPLYAVNMFYYYWLIKKLLWPIAGQNIARIEKIFRESRQSHGNTM